MKKIILCAFLIGVCGFYPAIAALTCEPCPCTDTITSPQTGYQITVSRYCDPYDDCKCKAGSTTYSCASGYYQSGNITCHGKQSTGIIECSGCKACPANSTTCDSPTIFTCKNGFYQSGTTCERCPTNATCTNNKITCNEDYYKSGTTCMTCPDDAKCANNDITCNQNYYQSGSKCESCGVIEINESDTITMVTDAPGATNKSECHLPDEFANTTFNTTYNGHNVTVKLTGSCSKN